MAETIPHRHLYTRLRVTPDTGIGVFAIRDIPAGTNPFEGDEGAMVRVPVEDVERITEPEVRNVYFDFCPVDNGAYLAPTNLNLLTTGWYMNHSDQPNVTSRGDIDFVTARPITNGEELTVDYSKYSDGAKRHLAERNGSG